MGNQVDNKVSIFTPVCSLDHDWIAYTAMYLKPFGGRMAIQVPGLPAREDGSVGVGRVQFHLPWYETALIIASYVLTLGILPLLAAIATAVIRCNYKFHWIQQQGPMIHINVHLGMEQDPEYRQAMMQFGAQVAPAILEAQGNPLLAQQVGNPLIQQIAAVVLQNPNALQALMGQNPLLGGLGQNQAALQALMGGLGQNQAGLQGLMGQQVGEPPSPPPAPITQQGGNIHGLGAQQHERAPAPTPNIPRTGGHRLTTTASSTGDTVEQRRQKVVDALEARLKKAKDDAGKI